MSFDPLHKWLGIPPKEQPPDLYRLLGITSFEDDLDVIEAAADRHLAFLHDMANSPEASDAEELANRISAARLRLTNKTTKSEYDAKLRREIDAAKIADSPNTTQHHALTTSQHPGWLLRYDDNVDRGPYSLEALVEAASLGYLSDSTLIRHPSFTNNEWRPAFSMPQLAKAKPVRMEGPPPNAVSSIKPVGVTNSRRKDRRSIGSRLASFIATGFPVLALAGLTVAVYRDPEFRDSLRAMLFSAGENEILNQTELTVGVDHRPQRVIPRSREQDVVTGATEPNPSLKSGENSAAHVERVDENTALRNVSSELSQSEITEPETQEKLHYLKLSLSDPRWTVPLVGANHSDQFFLSGTKYSRVPILVEPVSGKLGFDRQTLVTLQGLNGLGIELTLVSAAKPPRVRVSGRIVFDGKEFLLRNLLKKRNDLGRQLNAANVNLQSITARRDGFQAFLDSSGLKSLDRVHQAENEIKAISLRLPQLTAHFDAVQAKWMQLESIVKTIERIDGQDELIVSSIRKMDSSPLPSTAQP